MRSGSRRRRNSEARATRDLGYFLSGENPAQINLKGENERNFTAWHYSFDPIYGAFGAALFFSIEADIFPKQA